MKQKKNNIRWTNLGYNSKHLSMQELQNYRKIELLNEESGLCRMLSRKPEFSSSFKLDRSY